MRGLRTLTFFAVIGLAVVATPALAQKSFITFESGLVRPLALSPDGTKLFAVNTPDATLEIFDVTVAGISKAASVPVGMEPVAVAAHTNSEVWVVNHLSDSISVVDVTGEPRVTRTLLVGDEPRDIVFAGSAGNRAFITTAHRGQNSPFPLSEYNIAGADRADVWVFDATNLGATLGGTPITIVTLFGDKPRALAASADGSEVYAAIFHSGNKTTSVIESAVCNTSGVNIAAEITQGPCTLPFTPPLNSPGGVPIPHHNHEGDERPEVGIIVKQNRDGGVTGQWQDELGRDWSSLVNFSLPDLDVFKLDADAPLPGNIVTTQNWASVGTTIFNIAINPVSGKVYVSNTDAQNHVRFEGPGIFAAGFKPGGEPATVRGNLAQARITVIDGATVTPRHLNTHIDYSDDPQPVGVEDASLATPLNMVVTPDGATLYVASFGTGEIGVFSTTQLETGAFTPSDASHIDLSGGGPSGLVLDGDRIYTLTRFDNSVVVIDRTLGSIGQEIQSVPLHNPEPQAVVEGRPFLYDSLLTSSTGEASCASCHIEGDMDDIAWDLGNPDDDSVINGNPFEVGSGAPFHPMKGPMTTQSLRGLVFAGPQHWRGDRQGDSNAAFDAFNVAFPGLIGRDEGEFSAADMQKFTDFALEITYPPNPVRNLDNSLRANEQLGANLYTGPITDGVSDCNGCHVLDPANGFFGTDGDSSIEGETQEFKIPHLRNAYQKIGMFGVPPMAPLFGGDPSFQGDQVRGFGFLHDGAIDSLFRFLSSQVFGLNDTQQAQLEAFVMAFDTDLAPMVGQQITRSSTNGATVDARIDAMLTAATTSYPSKLLGPGATQCEVIVKGIVGGEQASGLFVSGGNILPDDGSPAIAETTVRALSNTPGQELTYTCVPFGSGNRMGLDRDEDGHFNRVDNCPDVANPAQTDSNMNDIGDVCEPGGGGPTTTTTITTTTSTTTTTTTTTTSTTTTTTLPSGLEFNTRMLKLGRLDKPAGEQRFLLKSDALNGIASDHNPLLEDVTLIISVSGVPQATFVVSASDLGWRRAGKHFKWRPTYDPHPSNMKSIKIGIPAESFKVRFKSKTADGTGAASVPNFGVNLQIGDDIWAGTTPSCQLSGSGKTLKCR
jgi:YVTN family beta-propeller protein